MTVNEPWLYHGYVSHNQRVNVDVPINLSVLDLIADSLTP